MNATIERASFAARTETARRFCASLDGLHPLAIRYLARGLQLAGGYDGPLYGLGSAFDCWADHQEIEDVGDGLATLKFAYEIDRLARLRPALVDQLADANEAPWPALREALLDRRGTRR